jgi:hypothetical protein
MIWWIAGSVIGLVLLNVLLYRIHEKHFLEAYNRGRQHQAQRDYLIYKNGKITGFDASDAFELGRKHAKKD